MEAVREVIIDFLSSEKFAVYRNILAVFGAAYVLRKLARTLWWLGGGFRAYFLAPAGISRINLKQHGSWAIVTGASEGIGKAYAIELASRGLNVALLSRSEEKLQKVAVEIRQRFGREVRCIAVDFTEGQSTYDDIQAEISDLDVAVLVNNVGLANLCPTLTSEIDEIYHRNIVELNCQAMVQMCHLVLPKMIENKRGVIVNVSSLTAELPCPLYSVYSATKKFVNQFSDSLRFEYKNKGIIVQTVIPGQVVTALSGVEKPSFFVPTAQTFARGAVATIGVQSVTFGYLPHALMGTLISLMPVGLSTRMMYGALMALRREKLQRQTGKKSD